MWVPDTLSNEQHAMPQKGILQIEEDCRLISSHGAWLMIVEDYAHDQQHQIQSPRVFHVGRSLCIFGICFHALTPPSHLSMSSKVQGSGHAMICGQALSRSYCAAEPTAASTSSTTRHIKQLPATPS